MTDRLRAALWLRVSTDAQDLEKDRVALEKFAEDLHVDIVKTYDVHASAWKGHHNPALDRMFADADAGEFDVLLITDLSRLSREGGDISMTIVKRLGAAGVQLRSLGDPELQGELTFGQRIGVLVKGELAHEQSLWRSLTTKRGIAAARAKGKRLGRPPGSKDKRKRKRDGYKREGARRHAEATRKND